MHMVLRFHRLAHWLYEHQLNALAKVVWVAMRVIFASDIGISCKIGKGVSFFHNGLGCVIHPRAVIGDGTKLYQNVTLGGNGKSGELNGVPVLGKDVFVGAGAVLVGPIKVGDGAMIGANSVVTCDVSAGAVVGGVPAKVLNSLNSPGG